MRGVRSMCVVMVTCIPLCTLTLPTELTGWQKGLIVAGALVAFVALLRWQLDD